MFLVATFTTSQVCGPLISCLLILYMEFRRRLWRPALWYVFISLVMLSNIKDKLCQVGELAEILPSSHVIHVILVITRSSVILVVALSHEGIDVAL